MANGDKHFPVYADTAAALTAGFPTSVMEARAYIEYGEDLAPVSGTFTIPAIKQVKLPIARANTSITITVGGTSRTVVAGSTPASGQVGYEGTTGVLTFHSGESVGASVAWSLTPKTTLIRADELTNLQAEVRAVQTAAQKLGVNQAANKVLLTDSDGGLLEVGSLTDAHIPSGIARDSEVAAGYQPLDATLTALAGVTTAADKVIYSTASDTFSTADFTAAGRALLDDATAADQRTTLGLGTMATATAADYATIAADKAAWLANDPKIVYVAAAGNDSTGNGSAMAPFATLDRAAQYVNATSGTAFVVRLGVGAFTWDAASSNQFPSSSKTVRLVGAGMAETVVTLTGYNYSVEAPAPPFPEGYFNDHGRFYLAGASDLSLVTDTIVPAGGHYEGSFFLVGEGQKFVRVKFDQSGGSSLTFSKTATGSAATLEALVVDCESIEASIFGSVVGGRFQSAAVVGATVTGASFSGSGGSVSGAVSSCSVSVSGTFSIGGTVSGCSVTAGTVAVVASARLAGCSLSATDDVTLGASARLTGCSLSATDDITIGAGCRLLDCSLSAGGDITGTAYEWSNCTVTATGSFACGGPAIAVGNSFTAAGTGRHFFYWTGTYSEAPIFRGNTVVNTGAFAESPSGAVALLMVFNTAAHFTIADNTFVTPTIAIMWGHTSTGIDSTVNSQDRAATITGNVFRVTFAAETGPDDRHGAVVLSGRGRIVMSGNLYDVNASAALNVTMSQNCVNCMSATAGTLIVFASNETYIFTGKSTALTSPSLRSAVAWDAGSGGAISIRMINASFVTGNIDYTVAGDGGSAVAIQGATSNQAITFETAPTGAVYAYGPVPAHEHVLADITDAGTMAAEDSADYTPTSGLGSAAFKSGVTGIIDPTTVGTMEFDAGVYVL